MTSLSERALGPRLRWSLPRLRWSARAQPRAARESPTADDDLGPALAHFARSDWSAAYRELRRLVARGVAQAARIASMMQAHGTRLFGGAFADAAAHERPPAERDAAAATTSRRSIGARGANQGTVRLALVGSVLVIAGVAAVGSAVVHRTERPATNVAATPAPAPATPALERSVPEASDVLQGVEPAPQADLMTYGG
jgi:hypothetical protein